MASLADWALRLTTAARGVADLALPQRCPGCGAPADPARFFCRTCWLMIPKTSTPLCARCLTRGRPPVGCVAHAGYQVWAAWIYDERAARAVQALKYEERFGLAVHLGAAIAAALPGSYSPDLVLEVPLHHTRQRERGYNQAALLADALADLLVAPRVESGLARVRATKAQARLKPEARRRNVGGAFRIGKRGRVKGRQVLIVDDVITTGATLEACLEVLDQAGAQATGAALAWAQ